jgi:rubrerythrin
MFTKKDYLSYFQQLYEVELLMIKDGKDLLKIIKEEEARFLIKKLIEDEKKHAKIVQEMIAIIK